MNINVTIGQFYPVDSKIHALDARTKLLSTLVFIIVLFFANNIIGYGLAVLFLGIIIKMTNVPPMYIFRGLKAVVFIIGLTVIFNLLFATGDTILFSFWIIDITLEGIYLALKMGSRLIMLIIASSIMTLTTSPIELTDGIERGLTPLKKIGVPAHEIAMMMTIALRFIPTLMEEVERIMKAQTARGANFDTGNLMQKAKSLIPLLVPLFISSFHRADDLAMAMEARCYRGDIGRTKMRQMVYSSADYFAYGILVLFCVLLIGSRFVG